jgi:hypothetical protein
MRQLIFRYGLAVFTNSTFPDGWSYVAYPASRGLRKRVVTPFTQCAAAAENIRHDRAEPEVARGALLADVGQFLIGLQLGAFRVPKCRHSRTCGDNALQLRERRQSRCRRAPDPIPRPSNRRGGPLSGAPPQPSLSDPDFCFIFAPCGYDEPEILPP